MQNSLIISISDLLQQDIKQRKYRNRGFIHNLHPSFVNLTPVEQNISQQAKSVYSTD